MHYGGQVPLPLLMVMPRLTVVAPSVALTVPTCLVVTVEVLTLKVGLTVWPSGMSTLGGGGGENVTPWGWVVESETVPPRGRAGRVGWTVPVVFSHPPVRTCFASSTFRSAAVFTVMVVEPVLSAGL